MTDSRSGDAAAAMGALSEALGDAELDDAHAELVRSLVGTVTRLTSPATDLLDLKIADAALREMVDAFGVFAPYRHVKKLTMFGSARTQAADPVYQLARDLAQAIADEGWMVVTGAGPGIMQAGTEGAGRERSFGVNIKLPMEQGANPVIAEDSKLVEMRYFFTRKLILVKESDAYAVLPGGYGTLDEAFELLTLVQTGKAMPAPIVLVETDGGGYWHGWQRFVEDQAASLGYISPEDVALYAVVNSVDEALEEINGFYRNYRSIRMVGDRLVIRTRILPSASELAALNRRFGDIVVSGAIEPSEPLGPERASNDSLDMERLVLRFDRHHYGRLRQLIDALNECTGS